MLSCGNLYAFGSGSKTPEEKAAEAALEGTKKYNNGVKHMDKASAIASIGDSTFAFNYRATSSSKARKEYEKAIKDFRKAVKLKPKFKEAYNNLGYCYRKIEKLDLSLKAYNNALQIDSSFARAREYRAETYLALGELKKARNELTILVNTDQVYAAQLSKAIEIYMLSMLSENYKAKEGD